VTTRLALPQEIEALALSAPSAVMVVLRHSYDANDRLIEATEAVYQSGHYSYEINLQRSSVHAMPFKVRTPAT
jgi:DNA-binding GntR family transcriptional regulator